MELQQSSIDWIRANPPHHMEATYVYYGRYHRAMRADAFGIDILTRRVLIGYVLEYLRPRYIAIKRYGESRVFALNYPPGGVKVDGLGTNANNDSNKLQQPQ